MIHSTFKGLDAEFERLDGAKTRSTAAKPLARFLRDYSDLNFGEMRDSVTSAR
jgi:hypothetical protein